MFNQDPGKIKEGLPLRLGRIGTEPAAVAAGTALLTGVLGQGLYSEAGLVEMAAYEQALGLGAWMGDQLVGAAVAQSLAPEDNAYYDCFGQAARERLSGRALGSLESLAVAPECRGQGIGKKMALSLMEWTAGQGCNLAVAISWMGEKTHPSWPLFKGLGFELVGESGEVYTIDSTKNGWSCPVCGNPCHCSGRLYVREL